MAYKFALNTRNEISALLNNDELAKDFANKIIELSRVKVDGKNASKSMKYFDVNKDDMPSIEDVQYMAEKLTTIYKVADIFTGRKSSKINLLNDNGDICVILRYDHNNDKYKCRFTEASWA